MHDEISNQHKSKGALPTQFHGLGNDIDECHREHVARAQRQKIMKKPPRPLTPYHKIATHNVTQCRDHPKYRRQRYPRSFVIDQVVSAPVLYPECRNKITSPSCTISSRPSKRTCAFSRAAAILPAASKSSHRATSARMNPFSMSL